MRIRVGFAPPPPIRGGARRRVPLVVNGGGTEAGETVSHGFWFHNSELEVLEAFTIK